MYYRFFSIGSEYRNAACKTSPQKHRQNIESNNIRADFSF